MHNVSCVRCREFVGSLWDCTFQEERDFVVSELVHTRMVWFLSRIDAYLIIVMLSGIYNHMRVEPSHGVGRCRARARQCLELGQPHLGYPKELVDVALYIGVYALM